MKLFDLEKAHNFSHEKPNLLWLSWSFIFAIIHLCLLFFIKGLLNDHLPLFTTHQH